jgi:hypothetical protein
MSATVELNVGGFPLRLPVRVIAPAVFGALVKLLAHKTPTELAGELVAHVPPDVRAPLADVLTAAVDHLAGVYTTSVYTSGSAPPAGGGL